MRLAILALAVLLAITACAAANPASTTNVAPIKNVAAETPPPPKGPMQGGDTIATAFVIGALPFDDTGTTVGYTHDYDEVCTYTGSLSPDVVYAYSPATNVMVDIYTCNSGYDTKIYVYDNVYTPGAPLACNDDSTICAGPAYRSYIQNLQLFAGHTYYIVVDGYGSASRRLRVPRPPLCEPPRHATRCFCPPGAIVNGEPTCFDGYVDTYNAGCNDVTTPYSFETFALNTTDLRRERQLRLQRPARHGLVPLHADLERHRRTSASAPTSRAGSGSGRSTARPASTSSRPSRPPRATSGA